MATKANLEMEGSLGVVDHTLTQIRLIGIENNPNCIGLIQRLVFWVLPLRQVTPRQAQGQSHDDESTTSTHDSKKYLQKACRLEQNRAEAKRPDQNKRRNLFEVHLFRIRFNQLTEISAQLIQPIQRHSVAITEL
jgi:hypothetical protein